MGSVWRSPGTRCPLAAPAPKGAGLVSGVRSLGCQYPAPAFLGKAGWEGDPTARGASGRSEPRSHCPLRPAGTPSNPHRLRPTLSQPTLDIASVPKQVIPGDSTCPGPGQMWRLSGFSGTPPSTSTASVGGRTEPAASPPQLRGSSSPRSARPSKPDRASAQGSETRVGHPSPGARGAHVTSAWSSCSDYFQHL